MLRSVMLPADFSHEFALVVGFTRGLAALGVRRVVFGHVVESSGLEGPIIAAKVDKAREQIRVRADELAEAGFDIEVRIGTGDPVQDLVGMANEAHVDAVVAGTHGKGRLSKLIAGSISEQIALEADVPTMLVRYDLLRLKKDPAEYAQAFGRTLIAAADFSAASTRALLSVLDLPSSGLGTVYLTHVLDPGLSGRKLEQAREGAGFQLRNQRAMAEAQGVTARGVVRVGDPARELLKEANERRATGIVVGTRGQNPLQEAVLGSTSMTLIRQASCPVLIVP